MVKLAEKTVPGLRSQALGCRILHSCPQYSAAPCPKGGERRARGRGRASELGVFGDRRRIPSKIGEINFCRNVFPLALDAVWVAASRGGVAVGAKSPFLDFAFRAIFAVFSLDCTWTASQVDLCGCSTCPQPGDFASLGITFG